MTFIGTAGWSISKAVAERFPPAGSSLARYAAVFNGVEVNSSFYRRHKPDTWRRWAESVPGHFRFSVKVPKRVTHELGLVDVQAVFDEFVGDLEPLGEKLGPVLLQLPPRLTFDAGEVTAFLAHARSVSEGRIVVEPRHPSWATPQVSELLSRYRIDLVVADPAVLPTQEVEKRDFVYLRLHGSPRIYYSSYDPPELARYSAMIASAEESWCIFDNTASGAALQNAIEMLNLKPA